MTRGLELENKIHEYPGSTDGALRVALGMSHQHVNGEARHLANLRRIVRVKGEDGMIRSYPHNPLDS